jgi:hypothetical protein
MKNIKNFSHKIMLGSLMFGALVVVSCKKAVETEPYSYFTSSNFFSNEAEAYSATLGVYDVMSSQALYGFNIPLIYDNDTDLGQTEGVDLSTDFRVIAHYNGTPERAAFLNTWSTFYNGIDRANVVLSRIPQMGIYTSGTQAVKDALNRNLAEAKFLRAFYYSELIHYWGDVPFKLTPSQTGDDFKLPRTNRYEIYKVILKEMEEAANALPTAIPTDERINKWAAKAMLARIALYAGGYALSPTTKQMERPANYKEYYTLAKQQIDEVMAQNVYKLNPSYAQVFKNQCQSILEPTENIFQVAFYNTDNNTISGNSLGGIFGTPSTALGVYFAANGRTLAVRPFYDSFGAGDTRRDFSIANYTIDAAGNKRPQVLARADETWRAAKWSREYQKQDLIERGTTRINFVVMRYSDLLLMRAEVENELNNGPNALAYDAINQVRRRAYGIDVPGSGITVSLTAPGSGYTSNLTTKFQVNGGGGGTDAAVGAVSVVAGTKGIGTIAMMNAGTGYTTVPTIAITTTDGKGTGATAVATLLPKATTADLPTGLSKDSFLKAVQQERAWELSYEGLRKTDLIRWNILKQTIDDTNTKVKAIRSNYNYTAAANFVTGKHELFPIPLSEIDVNKNMGQNPGY